MTIPQTIPKYLSWAKARELSVEAKVDPRSVKNVFAGKLVKGGAGDRAREVLIKYGYLAPDAPTVAAPAAASNGGQAA